MQIWGLHAADVAITTIGDSLAAAARTTGGEVR